MGQNYDGCEYITAQRVCRNMYTVYYIFIQYHNILAITTLYAVDDNINIKHSYIIVFIIIYY